MNCDEARSHWDLYHDSEGGEELYFQINAHLGQCSPCAEWFHQQSRLEELIAEKLGPSQPTSELWKAVLNQSGIARPASIRRWFFLGGLVATAACLLVAFSVWHQSRNSASSDLAQLAAICHEELVEGKRAVDFASQSDLKVERYLRERVSFPVRCPPRGDTGFLVEGAGICRIAGSQAAYLVGSIDGKRVSIFILDRDSLSRFPPQHQAVQREGTHQCRERGYGMVMAEIDRNVVLVVGQGNPRTLLKVLKAYGTYPDSHHG